MSGIYLSSVSCLNVNTEPHTRIFILQTQEADLYYIRLDDSQIEKDSWKREALQNFYLANLVIVISWIQ